MLPASRKGARTWKKLPDQFAEHLRLVFVGTAASQRSADTGHYYAHAGNRFWRTIHEVGITPRRYAPHEFRELLNSALASPIFASLAREWTIRRWPSPSKFRP